MEEKHLASCREESLCEWSIYERKLPSQQLHLLVSQAVFPLKETKELEQAPGKAELREWSKAVC